MTLAYESTLDDIAEPSYRLHLRKKGAQKAKFQSSLFIGLFFLTAAVITSRSSNSVEKWIVFGGLGLILCILHYLTHDWFAARRIRKYLKKQTKSRLPAKTVYHIEEDKLECDHLGVTISFPLKKLKKVSEDHHFMEISFGEIGLCTIPLRVF